jgi:hypothetical protein
MAKVFKNEHQFEDDNLLDTSTQILQDKFDTFDELNEVSASINEVSASINEVSASINEVKANKEGEKELCQNPQVLADCLYGEWHLTDELEKYSPESTNSSPSCSDELTVYSVDLDDPDLDTQSNTSFSNLRSHANSPASTPHNADNYSLDNSLAKIADPRTRSKELMMRYLQPFIDRNSYFKENNIVRERHSIDWLNVKSDYVRGFFISDPHDGRRHHVFPTLNELALKWNINPRYIKGKSAEGKWTVEREAFRKKIEAKLEEQHSTALTSESAYFDAQNLRKLTAVHQILDEYLKPYMDAIATKNTHTDELAVDLPPVKMNELKELVNILKESHQLARNVVGEPLNTAQISKQVEKELQKKENRKATNEDRLKRIEFLSRRLVQKKED